MNAENRAVMLEASRLELLPQAIVLVAFLLAFALLAISYGYALVGKDYVEIADLAILAIFGSYGSSPRVASSAHTSSYSLGVLFFAVLCWISDQLDVPHQLVRNSTGQFIDLTVKTHPST